MVKYALYIIIQTLNLPCNLWIVTLENNACAGQVQEDMCHYSFFTPHIHGTW